MRRIKTEDTPPKSRDFARKTLFAAWFAVSALTATAGLAGPATASETHGASVGAAAVEAPASAVDDIETGSIALPISKTGVLTTALARTNGVDTAVAGTVASVHVPAYLSILADRRVLAMLCLFGLLVVWINRTPPRNNRDL